MFDFDLLEETDPQHESGDEITSKHIEGLPESSSAKNVMDISQFSEVSNTGATAFEVHFSTLGMGVVALLNLHRDVTAVEVKKKLQMRLRIPRVEQQLLFGVAVWEDDCSLGDARKECGLDDSGPVQITVLRVPLAKRVALSGSRDGALIIWDIERGSRLRQLNGHDGGVTCVAVHWASQRAISGGADRNLRTWDLAQGKVVQQLEGHAGAVTCLAVAWACSRAVSGSSDNTLREWDLGHGTCSKQLNGHNAPVTCVAVNDSALRAISGGEDRLLLIWDLSAGEVIQECHGHVSPVNCVVCDAGLTQAASGGFGTLKFWNFGIWKTSTSLQSTQRGGDGFNWLNLGGHSQAVTCTSVDWSTRRCLTGSSDATLCLWNVDSRRTARVKSEVITAFSNQPRTIRMHSLPITCLAVDWISMCAVTGGDDCIFVWDLQEVKTIHELQIADVSCVAIDSA